MHACTPDSEYFLRGHHRVADRMEGRAWLSGHCRSQPVKNQTLWEHLDELAARHEIDGNWVPGHAASRQRAADKLANGRSILAAGDRYGNSPPP